MIFEQEARKRRSAASKQAYRRRLELLECMKRVAEQAEEEYYAQQEMFRVAAARGGR